MSRPVGMPDGEPAPPARETQVFDHRELEAVVRSAGARLREMSVEAARRRPRPDKWSPAEIIGHLIDSASNNHRRFVIAQGRADLRFDGYDQDAWVAAQHYRTAPWPALVALWEAFNLHIAHVIECMPVDERTRVRTDHNLDIVAWETVPATEPVTLDYFISDYVAHLKHHLRQIDEALAPEPTPQRA